MNPVLAKIELYTHLSEPSRSALRFLSEQSIIEVKSRHDLITQGDSPRYAFILLNGWAARQETLGDGRRQITAFLLPGDVFDLHAYLLRSTDYGISALTDIRVARVSRESFERLTDEHPDVAKGLLWQQLVELAIEREWVVNVGQRSGRERICHLLCELFYRLKSVGLAANNSCILPLTQADIGEATGMSTVHVNRVLQSLRREGLLMLRNKKLSIPDFGMLESEACFDPAYLHLASDRPIFRMSPLAVGRVPISL